MRRTLRIAFPLAGRSGSRGSAEAARPGGADISTLELARELKRRGHAPLVVVHNDGPTVDYVNSIGLETEVIGHPALNKRAEITPEAIEGLRGRTDQVRALIQKHGIDLVHTNDASLHRTWGFYCEWLGLKQVWHERGLFSHPEVSQSHLRRAAKILTISRYVQSLAPEDLQPQIGVIDNPIRITASLDKSEDREWLHEELGAPAAAFIMVMVANANTRKRWPMYMEAAGRATRERKDLHFCCIGNADAKGLQALLKQHWDKDARKRFHSLGYRYDVPRIMSGADAVVATSRKEPLGRTVIESVLARTAVLASHSGAHREIFKKAAPFCLVKPDTAEAFAERFLSIEQTLKAYEKVSARSQRDFSRKYAPARHADAVEAVYLELLPEPAATSMVDRLKGVFGRGGS